MNTKMGYFFAPPHLKFCLSPEKNYYVFILFPAVEERYCMTILLRMFVKTAKWT